MTMFRERVKAREPLIGTFLQMGSAVAAEIVGLAGFDWALIDLEHGAGSEGDLVPQLLGLAASDVASVVRVESCTRLRIGRALDLGAGGIMVPQVNDPGTARDLVNWCEYPPTGARGVALSARGAGYGRSGHGDVGSLGRAIVRIAQIETGAAIQAVASIAATEGLDVLFVGPSDLSHSLGVPGRFDDPTFTTALEAVVGAASKHGCVLGVHVPNITELERYRGLGFTLISIGSDSTGMAASLRATIGAARSSAA